MLRLSQLRAAMAMRAALGYGPGDALCTDKSGPPPILQDPRYNPKVGREYKEQSARGTNEPSAEPLQCYTDERTGLPYYNILASRGKNNAKPPAKRKRE